MRQRSVRVLEKSLGAAQWCLVIAAAWVLLQATLLRDTLPQPAIAAPGDAPLPDSGAVPSASVDELAAIWQRDLQQELIPKPPEKKPEPKPAPPPPPVHLPKLLATFVEDGQSWGLFVESNGSQRVRPASGTVDGFSILTIAPGLATLEKVGKKYEIQVPRADTPSSPRMTNRRN